MRSLDDILTFEMDSTQAKAYKIALLWEELTQKEFPGERHVRLKKTGDPRKSLLFRHCYKLVRDTQGIITDQEYKLYVIAQLQILKLQTNGQVHALISPECLDFQNGWKRWQVWRRHFDKKMKQHQTAESAGVKASETIVIQELEESKKFLFSKIGQPNLESMKMLMKDYTLVRWITLEKVTPFYVLLSPLVVAALGGKSFEEHFLFDLSLYKPSITDEIRRYFHKSFAYEFVQAECK